MDEKNTVVYKNSNGEIVTVYERMTKWGAFTRHYALLFEHSSVRILNGSVISKSRSGSSWVRTFVIPHSQYAIFKFVANNSGKRRVTVKKVGNVDTEMVEIIRRIAEMYFANFGEDSYTSLLKALNELRYVVN